MYMEAIAWLADAAAAAALAVSVSIYSRRVANDHLDTVQLAGWFACVVLGVRKLIVH